MTIDQCSMNSEKVRAKMKGSLRENAIMNKWLKKKLDQLTQSPISYGVVQAGEHQKGISCIRVVDLTKRQFNQSKMIKTTNKISNAYKRTILRDGDLMVALRGEIGLVRLADKQLEGCNLTRGVARINPIREVILPQYLLYAMQSYYFVKDLYRRINGSALQEISIEELR